MPTLPDQREETFLVNLIDDIARPKPGTILPDGDEIILVATQSYSEATWQMEALRRACKRDKEPFLFTGDLHRMSIIVHGPVYKTKIIFCTIERPEMMHGFHPTHIYFMGRFGEFMMLALSSGARLGAIG